MSELKAVKVLVDTEDVGRLAHFYADSFGMKVTQEMEGWAEIEFGTAAIGFHGGGDASKEAWTPLSFTVTDLELTGKAVESNGGTIVNTPYDPGEGPFLLATYRDPERNLFMARQDV